MNQPNQPSDPNAPQQPQDPNAISIELTEEVAEGQYANLAMIAHSTSEFVIDFIRLMPGLPKAKVKSRIILTPEHAKRLATALAENIERYEKAYGTIKLQPEEQGYPMGFGGKMGEA